MRFKALLGPLGRAGIALLLLSTVAGPAFSQDAWPQKPVRMIVPLPPGGTADTLMRLLGQKLSELWLQPVIVENRPGAGGIIGTAALARSAADGYTIGLGNTNMQVTNEFLYESLPYRPESDFAPIAWLTTNPMFLIVHPSVPADNLSDFLAYARANPGKLSFASNGRGSSMHLATELLMQRAGIRMVHVPYKGMGAAVQDLLNGNVQVAIDISTMAQVRQGKLKALGVLSEKRYPGASQVPSFAEQGLAAFELVSWLSLHAPARVPESILARINADVNRVLAMQEVRERLSGINMDPKGGTPEELASHLQSERRRFGELICALGIKAE